MAAFSRFTVLAFVIAGTCLSLISPRTQAQDDETSQALAALVVKSELQPAKDAFRSLDRCRTQLPAGVLKEKFTEAETRLADGLLIGWGGGASWPATPPPLAAIASRYYHSPSAWASKPPPLYLRSLQNDAAACLGAIGSNHSAKETSMVIQIIAADLIVKARDCYSHGMGRLVGIQVSTKRGKTPDPGWTVYYKWVSVSDIPTAETPFQTSSTPAKDKLPPGIYQLRAEKSIPGSASVLHSEVKMIPLDSTHDRCELQVP
ncbi:MAG TPA: hypothetical protein VF730_05480 [Terracidiphilus sp.]